MQTSVGLISERKTVCKMIKFECVAMCTPTYGSV